MKAALREASRGLPALSGDVVVVRFTKELTVSGGKLHSESGRGLAVSAATYLLERRMVLDVELLQDANELRRILIHELFHFVWWKLGNTRRREWDLVLWAEWRARARGELGWSSEWRKNALRGNAMESDRREWRQYICESFCDTASWYLGSAHEEHTLAERHCKRREAWFRKLLASGALAI